MTSFHLEGERMFFRPSVSETKAPRQAYSGKSLAIILNL